MIYKYIAEEIFLPIRVSDTESRGTDYTGEKQFATISGGETEIKQEQLTTSEVIKRMTEAEKLIGKAEFHGFLVNSGGLRDTYRFENEIFYLHFDPEQNKVIKIKLTGL